MTLSKMTLNIAIHYKLIMMFHKMTLGMMNYMSYVILLSVIMPSVIIMSVTLCNAESHYDATFLIVNEKCDTLYNNRLWVATIEIVVNSRRRKY